MTKFQIQYRSPAHSKGPDYWQPTTQVFKTRERAEEIMAKHRANPSVPGMEFRIIER